MWDDGHEGHFDITWLHQRQFADECREERRKWLPLDHKQWGHQDMQDKVPTDTFDHVSIMYTFLYATQFFCLQNKEIESLIILERSISVIYLLISCIFYFNYEDFSHMIVSQMISRHAFKLM